MKTRATPILAALLMATVIPGSAFSQGFNIIVEPPRNAETKSQPDRLSLHQAPHTEPSLSAHGWSRDGVGSPVEFRAWSNYNSFIARAEIRILLPGARTGNAPIAVLPIQPGGIVTWSSASFAQGSIDYIYRVYDARGRYDETAPKRLVLGGGERPQAGELLFYAQNNGLKRQTIPIRGGAITARGTGIRAGERVHFVGQDVPVDAKGQFSATQILPQGPQIASVDVVDGDGRILRRAIHDLAVADENFFYVALADLTVGQGQGSGPVAEVTGSTAYDGSTFVDGRLAFYVKGYVRGDWLLTAALDTREGPVEDLFNNILKKDPGSILARLDPDAYYPVYGDGSVSYNDAPTDGKLYVRLEKGAHDFLLGNYRTNPPQNELTGFSRSLFGARVRSGTAATMENGAERGSLELFAAEAGTLQSREEFRGTGGSQYYLRHRDIQRGSERVWIETRNAATGLLEGRKELVQDQDYTVNAFQGQLQLTNPLLASGEPDALIRSTTGASSQFLVVTYEYSPGLSASQSLVAGGTGAFWITEKLRLGASALRQTDNAQSQNLYGLDARFVVSDRTHIQLDVAQSEDPGTPTLRSLDGGFTFSTLPNSGSGTAANAIRVELESSLNSDDFSNAALRIIAQKREAGFTGAGHATDEDTTDVSVEVSGELTHRLGGQLVANYSDSPSQTTAEIEANISYSLSDSKTLSFGIKTDDKTTRTANASSTLSAYGQRTDVILRFDNAPEDANWSGYAFAQATVARSGARADNNRLGLGADWAPNEQLTLGGEVSHGDGGAAARVLGSWAVDDRSRVYTSYELTSNRETTSQEGRIGQLTVGGETRLSEKASLYAEQTYQHGDGPRGTANAIGLDYAASDSWVLGSKIEYGQLTDPISGDIDRKSVSGSAAYHTDTMLYSAVLEFRQDNGTQDRKSWATKHKFSYQHSDDWRLLGNLAVTISNVTGGAQDHEYAEFALGAAYRPVRNDRWNALVLYRYVQDSGAGGQISANGSTLDYAQKSHVFSLDATYQLTDKLALGGKIGARIGEIRDLAVAGAWVRSDALLAIARVDYEFAPSWGAIAEYRILKSNTAKNRTQGGLIAVSKKVKDNVKITVGYNATDFSDDLTVQDYTARGWFLNLTVVF